MILNEKLIVIPQEDDLEEAIEAVKNTVWKNAVEVLAISPKSLEEESIESIKSRISASEKPYILVALAANLWLSSDYERNLANVLNDPDTEEKTAKSIEEFNKKFEVRELPRMLDWVDTKQLIDDTPFYDKFLKKGKRSNNNHWWDKSKFKNKVTRWKKV